MTECPTCGGEGRYRGWVDRAPRGYRADWRRAWFPCTRCRGVGDLRNAAAERRADGERLAQAREALAARVAAQADAAFHWLIDDLGFERCWLDAGAPRVDVRYRRATLRVVIMVDLGYDWPRLEVSVGRARQTPAPLPELLEIHDLPPIAGVSLDSLAPACIAARLAEASAALRSVVERARDDACQVMPCRAPIS